MESFDRGFAFGITSNIHGLAIGNHVFWIVQVEDITHHFMQCSIACKIWSYISQIWQILSQYYWTLDGHVIFAQFTKVNSKLEMEIVLLFLRYLGLHHNWDMHNAFVFDGWHGVEHIYEC